MTRISVLAIALIAAVLSAVCVDAPVTMAGAGDIAICDGGSQAETAALLATINPGKVFALGDVSNDNGTTAEYEGCYGPTWGAFKASTLPVIGNHDYYSDHDAAAPFFSYWGAAAGTAGKGWYAYDYGSWRIYALNGICAYCGNCGPTSEQLNWLNADLAANKRLCSLAMFHYPLFSSGHYATPSQSVFWDALLPHGVEVILNGHDHLYERFAPQDASGSATAAGIRQFTVGTGGASHHSFEADAGNSEKLILNRFGVLKLTLHLNYYEWQFIGADANGDPEILDSGSAYCHQ